MREIGLGAKEKSIEAGGWHLGKGGSNEGYPFCYDGWSQGKGIYPSNEVTSPALKYALWRFIAFIVAVLKGFW